MPTSPLFGRIFIPRTIEQAAKNILLEWFPSTLKEIEAQQGLDIGSTKIPLEQNYRNRNKFDALSINDVPLVTIISPGIMGTPVKTGQGIYRAVWRLGVGVATAAETEEQAKLLCDMYGAAAVDIMIKQGGTALGGRIEWLDAQFVDLPIVDQLHQFRAAALYFSVDIENIYNSRARPGLPNAEPYIPHTADSVIIELEKE